MEGMRLLWCRQTSADVHGNFAYLPAIPHKHEKFADHLAIEDLGLEPERFKFCHCQILGRGLWVDFQISISLNSLTDDNMASQSCGRIKGGNVCSVVVPGPK